MRFNLFSMFIVAAGTLAGVSQANAGFFTGLNSAHFDDQESAVAGNQNGTNNSGLNTNNNPVNLEIGTRLYGDLSVGPDNGNSGVNISGIFDVTSDFILDANGNELQNGTGANLGFVTDSTNAAYTGYAYVLFGSSGANGLFGNGTYTQGSDTFNGLSSAAGTMLELFNNNSGSASNVDGIYGNTNQVQSLNAAEGQSSIASFGFTNTGSASDWGASGNGYWYAEVYYSSGASASAANGINFAYGLTELGTQTLPISQALYNPGISAVSLAPQVPPSTGNGNQISQNEAGTSVFSPANSPGIAFDLVGKGGTNTVNNTPAWGIGSSDPFYIDVAPEPATLTIWGLGTVLFGGVGAIRRRKKA